MFVHGLGGHARGTWTYKGPKRDTVLHESREEVTRNDVLVDEVRDANVPDPSLARSRFAVEAVGQSVLQTQEERKPQNERAKRSCFKHLKNARIRLLSPASRGRDKAKEQGQSQWANTGSLPPRENPLTDKLLRDCSERTYVLLATTSTRDMCACTCDDFWL